MHIEQSYNLGSSEVIVGLEDLAESFIDPRYRKEYTIRGITTGKSRDEERILLPKKYRRRELYQIAVGINYQTFEFLLDAARQIKRYKTFFSPFDPPVRFNLGELVGHNLEEGESVWSVLSDFDVLGKDDLTWFL